MSAYADMLVHIWFRAVTSRVVLSFTSHGMCGGSVHATFVESLQQFVHISRVNSMRSVCSTNSGICGSF